MPLTQDVIIATNAGDIEKVTSFLNDNLNSINDLTTDGLSLLQLAILNRHNELAKYLIEKKANTVGMVEYASLAGNTEVIPFLPSQGIEIPQVTSTVLSSSGGIGLTKSRSSLSRSGGFFNGSSQIVCDDEDEDDPVNLLKEKLCNELIASKELTMTRLDELLKNEVYGLLRNIPIISLFGEFDPRIQEEQLKRTKDEKKTQQALSLVGTLFKPEEETGEADLSTDSIGEKPSDATSSDSIFDFDMGS
ncbi:MAG: ankyrin repeat domain-containing protein [Proteobacteria bacterium]|nr:ankyrin repeat domain-containing protein [Pseudomonadota bacterium]